MRTSRKSGTRDVTQKLLLQASPTILLVQHGPGRIELLHFVLEDAGFVVHAAPSLSRAICDLRKGLSPGVALLDLPDNGVGGAAFAEAAREIPALADLPVIVITEPAEALRLCGTTSFLLKPFRVGDLLEALRAHGVPTRVRLEASGT